MDTTLDADLELLGATAERHGATLTTRSCVHLSAAIDALTDPLVPPRLSGVDDDATTDPAEVLQAVRRRLVDAARHTDSVQRTLAIGFAARELTHALAALAPDPAGSTAGRDGDSDVPRSTADHGGAAEPGRPGR